MPTCSMFELMSLTVTKGPSPPSPPLPLLLPPSLPPQAGRISSMMRKAMSPVPPATSSTLPYQ